MENKSVEIDMEFIREFTGLFQEVNCSLFRQPNLEERVDEFVKKYSHVINREGYENPKPKQNHATYCQL